MAEHSSAGRAAVLHREALRQAHRARGVRPVQCWPPQGASSVGLRRAHWLSGVFISSAAADDDAHGGDKEENFEPRELRRLVSPPATAGGQRDPAGEHPP